MTAPAITSVADAEAPVQLVKCGAPIPDAKQPAVAVLREQVDAALGLSRQVTALRRAHARIIALRALGPDATIAQLDAWARHQHA